MKIIGINGSPRIGGNADILLDKALEGARSIGAETEKVILNTLKIAPCQECENLKDDGSCIIEDDMQGLYRKILEADAVIVASPVFFGSITAQTKIMIDRFQCLWRAKFILKKNTVKKEKVGAFISVEASNREDFFVNARSIVKNFFAVIDASYREEILCRGIDEKGKVLERLDCLEKVFELGAKVASFVTQSQVQKGEGS